MAHASGAGNRRSTTVYPCAYLEFLKLFNAEAFWESHEVLETPWRENRSAFYQGLIIFASAFVHAQRGNPNGVRKQLLKAVDYLTPYAPHYMGLDISGVLKHAQRCLEIVRQQPHLSGQALTAAVPRMRLVPNDAFVRGDEVELAAE